MEGQTDRRTDGGIEGGAEVGRWTELGTEGRRVLDISY